MSRNIFIDCGAHFGESIRHFMNTKMYSSRKWEIFSFEAHPYGFSQIPKSYKKASNITVENKAVWIEETKKDLYFGRGCYGGCSLIKEKKTGHFDLNNPISVDCFDFSLWMKQNFTDDDFIVLKMDIEGAEYQVIAKMLKDNTFSMVNEFFVEFHNAKIDIPKSKDKELMDCIKKCSPHIRITEENNTSVKGKSVGVTGTTSGNWFVILDN